VVQSSEFDEGDDAGLKLNTFMSFNFTQQPSDVTRQLIPRLLVWVQNRALVYHHFQPHCEKKRAAETTNLMTCLYPFPVVFPPL